jgi:hypothetical protein
LVEGESVLGRRNQIGFEGGLEHEFGRFRIEKGAVRLDCGGQSERMTGLGVLAGELLGGRKPT